MLRKGASIKNVMIFTGTWAACKVPMLLIEVSSLGAKFTIVRLVVEMIGIILVAEIISRVINDEDRNLIYKNAKNL